ncbi:MAG: adenine deaminase [Bacteroidetes bacterium]|nr:adenine deaminase [Bacteroidota bacterium]MBU1486188.1 adenine deaminase [Bacteroidota bacterium]MBU2045304.1 adenine deaminase [Bacteroidota bacterium]MBU2269448.1 adenine deaminase [Bacteroidota bacterium]MBU2375498.1 adenine deaminase [Bacteroidota bacterium]
MPTEIIAQLVDIPNRIIYPAKLTFLHGLIQNIERIEVANSENLPFLTPGFVDAHVHIESSMLVPSEFAKIAVRHGSVGTVSDPHEIANVCGMAGIEYMIDNGNTVPFKFNFGVPSCVPATIFETAGAEINVKDIELLLARADIKYLAEMMNFPGVLMEDEMVMAKIAAAKAVGKPIDGHAPGLRGKDAGKYISAGISTDHECFTYEEALDKLQQGMKILIREGSAAKNFDALIDLLNDYPNEIMFCSDDKHPDSLVEGHIDQLCARAVKKGINIFDVLKAACVNPVLHYQLNIGLLNIGDPADFILLKDLKDFKVLATYIDGKLVAKDGVSLIKTEKAALINHFSCKEKQITDFTYPAPSHQELTPVIEAIDSQLITYQLMEKMNAIDGLLLADVERDFLKIAVVNRYHDAPIAKAFIKNFGLKEGAIASSVAHDSHNIVVVGVDDESMCKAVNALIKVTGGISCISNDKEMVLPLPVAGIMTNEDGDKVAKQYTAIDLQAKKQGATLISPFMTLSFMALLVIPKLKLSDLGLFDGERFNFI